VSVSPEEDAIDCANYIRMMRLRDDWDRFDLGIEDFFLRNKDVRSVASLRQLLADAYDGVAADDDQGLNRIHGRT